MKKICTLLAEIAQFNSEILEVSIVKNSNKTEFVFLEKYIQQLSDITVEDIRFFDSEDQYRMDYFRRKYPIPPNILHSMTEGHVEDFFGAWLSADEKQKGHFNPDKNWGIIFDIP